MLTDTQNLTEQQRNFFVAANKHPRVFAEGLLVTSEEGNPPFVANFMQKLVMDSKANTNWICVSRRSGKCIDGSSLVIHPVTLRPTPIKDLVFASRTLVFDFETNEVVWSNCEWIFSGFKKCIKLFLGTGVELVLSEDHLLFDWKRGWVPASAITMGDRVLAPARIRIEGPDAPNEEEILFAVEQALTFSTIPDCVFRFNKTCLARFIAEYWFDKGKILHNDRLIVFLMWCRELALDFHHLLLRYEVESTVDEDGNLLISDPIDRNRFLNLIGIETPVLEVRSPRRWEIVTGTRKMGNREVYDLSVSHRDHNFIANDVVVHNSFCMTILALWLALTRRNKNIVLFAPSTTQIHAFFDVFDKWVYCNPWVEAMKHHTGWTSQPNMKRTFTTGSKVEGYITGMSGGLEGSRRGLTPDYILVDEAQEMSKEDWKVIEPMMIGDTTRMGKIKTWIAGTIKEPEGNFFEKCTKREKGKSEEIFFIPITDNPDFDKDQKDEIRKTVSPETWQTEYLLQVGEADTAVFRKHEVEACCMQDWDYGPEMINTHKERIMGVDWDKGQAGTNIAIVQYDTIDQSMKTIYRYEVPRGDFTYTNACRLILELYDWYMPSYVVADQGAGEQQWEILMLESMRRGSGLANSLIKLAFNSKVEITNPGTGELEKKLVKPFLVGRLARKIQERKFYFPAHDFDMRTQFTAYKILKTTANTVKYSSTNEHIIDCHSFCMYAIYEFFEREFEGNDPANHVMKVYNIDDERSFIEPEQEERFWGGLTEERMSVDGPNLVRTDLFKPFGRSSFDEF
jgi:hypothetical protein